MGCRSGTLVPLLRIAASGLGCSRLLFVFKPLPPYTFRFPRLQSLLAILLAICSRGKRLRFYSPAVVFLFAVFIFRDVGVRVDIAKVLGFYGCFAMTLDAVIMVSLDTLRTPIRLSRSGVGYPSFINCLSSGATDLTHQIARFQCIRV